MNHISVLIVDDHTLIREAWQLVINAGEKFKVIATAGCGKEALELTKFLHPDIVLMDINMPDLDGIEVTGQIKAYAPRTKILGVSSHTNAIHVRKIFEKGASGYVTKRSSKDELLLAMTEVMNGNRYICDEIKDSIAEKTFNDDGKTNLFQSLSRRELEVGNWVRQGLSSKEVAVKLGLSPRTVEVHRHNILKKLNLKKSSALVDYLNKQLPNLN